MLHGDMKALDAREVQRREFIPATERFQVNTNTLVPGGVLPLAIETFPIAGHTAPVTDGNQQVGHATRQVKVAAKSMMVGPVAIHGK